MMFANAKKLDVGDKVAFKLTGNVISIVRIDIEEKDVFIYGDDKRYYHHTAVKQYTEDGFKEEG